jgi:hypothetical protein
MSTSTVIALEIVTVEVLVTVAPGLISPGFARAVSV